MFDFGNKDENLTVEKVKAYFKEKNFFGIEPYVFNLEADEIKVFANIFVVKNVSERKKVEKYFGEKKETELKFPLSIGKQEGILFLFVTG